MKAVLTMKWSDDAAVDVPIAKWIKAVLQERSIYISKQVKLSPKADDLKDFIRFS
jgi:hypothetical protein